VEIMKQSLVLCFVLAFGLISALPPLSANPSTFLISSEPPASSAEAPLPKVPDATQLRKQLGELILHLKEELADEKASGIARSSLFDESSISLNAALSRADSALHIGLAMSAICNTNTAVINQTKSEAGEYSTRTTDMHIADRADQIQTKQSQVKAAVDQVVAWIDNTNEMRGRIDAEIASHPDARGNGINFDKFVTHHPKAVEQLQTFTAQTSKLKTLLQQHANHIQTASQAFQNILQCPDCKQTGSLVVQLTQQLAAALQANILECEQRMRGDSVIREQIAGLQHRLQQIRDAELAQQSEQQNRIIETKSQLTEAEHTLSSTY